MSAMTDCSTSPTASTEFGEDAALADAQAVDGLSDFGDQGFRKPLRELLASLAEAPLHDLGAKILRGSVVRSLANRLRAHDPRSLMRSSRRRSSWSA